ncbi:MAG: DUF2294 domain-containing protein [Nostoc sp. CreGUA01]|nr:DUF2294 domain-containing protein [Nostoc sp. CreGUA01]
MRQPTIGQLETEISEQIKSLYHEKLGKPPSQIICHFFDNEIVISIENSLTPVEETLLQGGCDSLAEKVRLYLDRIIKPQLKKIIEEIIGKSVLDLMTNTNLATGRTGIIVVLKSIK